MFKALYWILMAGRRKPYDTPGAANPVQSSLNEYKTNTVLQLLMSAMKIPGSAGILDCGPRRNAAVKDACAPRDFRRRSTMKTRRNRVIFSIVVAFCLWATP